MRKQRTDETLRGGHFSQPVRSGTEVRKPSGTWTKASFELLQLLEEKGFEAAPRALRVQESGEAALTYLEGDVASGAPLPAYAWSMVSLVAVTTLLLRLHDLTEGWKPRSDDWRRIPGAPKRAEVICHNDPAPWNTLFRDGRPAAFVDWDSAAPGTRLWDVGYLAWHWVPLWPDARARAHGFVELATRPDRLAMIATTYGHGLTARAILDAAEARQQAWRTQLTQGARAGIDAYQKLLAAGSEQGILADMEYTQHHRDEFLRASGMGCVGST